MEIKLGNKTVILSYTKLRRNRKKRRVFLHPIGWNKWTPRKMTKSSQLNHAVSSQFIYIYMFNFFLKTEVENRLRLLLLLLLQYIVRFWFEPIPNFVQTLVTDPCKNSTGDAISVTKNSSSTIVEFWIRELRGEDEAISECCFSDSGYWFNSDVWVFEEAISGC